MTDNIGVKSGQVDLRTEKKKTNKLITDWHLRTDSKQDALQLIPL
jgi:hypothetical protein